MQDQNSIKPDKSTNLEVNQFSNTLNIYLENKAFNTADIFYLEIKICVIDFVWPLCLFLYI